MKRAFTFLGLIALLGTFASAAHARIYNVGGAVKAPVVLKRPPIDYSECASLLPREARRGRVTARLDPRMNHDDPERPVGVTVAATLIALVGIAGVVARARGANFGLLSAVWLITHIVSLIVAIGLWRLKPWSYRLFIAFVIGGMVLTVTRIVAPGSSSGFGYHFLRLAIMVAWLIYFSRWQVRAVFAPPGSGYGR